MIPGLIKARAISSFRQERMKNAKTKKYIFALVLLSGVLIVGLFLNETTRWPFGPLTKTQGLINFQADVVYRTGQSSRIVFVSAGEDEMIVISPPYVNIADLGKNVFSPGLLEKMQSFVNRQETGHLFYIKRGKLADHRLLSGLVVPILGMETKKEIVFLLSREAISGRPVKMKILDQ